MSSKAITLAAVSMSALALYVTEASAQATPFYNSPAQAKTYNDDGARWSRPAFSASRRTVVHPRGADAYATAPHVRWVVPAVDNTHPSIGDY
jgi:hypothetical protein